MSDGEFKKMVEAEKKETAELTEKYKKKLDALKVSSVVLHLNCALTPCSYHAVHHRPAI